MWGLTPLCLYSSTAQIWWCNCYHFINFTASKELSVSILPSKQGIWQDGPAQRTYRIYSIIRLGCNWEDPRKKQKKELGYAHHTRRYRTADGLSRLGGDRLKYWITNTAKMQNGDHKIWEGSFNTWIVPLGVASRHHSMRCRKATLQDEIRAAKFAYKTGGDFKAKSSGKKTLPYIRINTAIALKYWRRPSTSQILHREEKTRLDLAWISQLWKAHKSKRDMLHSGMFLKSSAP